MTMLPAPASYRGIAARIGLIISGGGAGTLATLALVHKPSTPVIGAAAAIAAVAASAIQVICEVLPDTINAISELLSTWRRARADARKTIIMARLRADLARAGTDPAETAQAVEMLRLLAVDPDLPEDRRLNDDALTKLIGTVRLRKINAESDTGPESPGSAPNRSRAGSDKVVHLR